MKFVQINLNTCKLAHNLLSQFVLEEKIDICLASEPNVYLSQGWSGHVDAKIWKVNRNIYEVGSGSGTGFSWLETETYLIISIYSSGNDSIEDLERTLMELSSLIQPQEKKVILGGDLNAKSPEWGSNKLDRRGRILSEWIAAENLVIANQGNTPTFKKRDMESVIDITLASEGLQISNWKVIDDVENGSDHQYICFEITQTITQTPTSTKGWNLKTFDIEKLKECMGMQNMDDIESAEDLTTLAANLCKKTMKTRVMKSRREVHWWNDNIKEMRKECIKSRRYLTRRKRTATEEEKKIMFSIYKTKRTNLNLEISKAKKEGWKKICKDLEEDVWGLAYKIVTKKIGRTIPHIPDDIRERVINHLFPSQPQMVWDQEDFAIIDESEDITTDEIVEAALKAKPKKAPGPDSIPALIVRAMVMENPAIFHKVFNNLWRNKVFPLIWKEAKVCLIEKPRKNPNEAPAFRPICLLNTLGKTFETILNQRLKKELQDKSLLSNSQYGFREGKSTIDAINEVVTIARNEMAKPYRKRKLCILITVDIQNAFNTANWKEINKAMKNMGINKHLTKLIESYLKERKIVGEAFEKWMTAGVPQGSILGPTLWIILYNSILTLTFPEGVFLVAYADDLSILILGKNEEEIETKAREVITLISGWMREKQLKIAPEKSELIVLSGKKKCRPLDIDINGVKLQEKNQVKYLGVVLDKSLKFGHHLEYVCEKAGKTIKALSGILPRVGGPGESKRRILQSAAESIILYAAPVWADCLNIKKRRTQIIRAQRPGSLRVCSGYRTISNDAMAVISGTIPLDLLLEERARNFKMNTQEKETEREKTMNLWQERWNNSTNGAWTRTLIKDINPWVTRNHGEIDYHITQVFSGHGCFEFYKNRFKLASEPNCLNCGDIDTAEHTVFSCPRWSRDRFLLSQKLDGGFSKENMVVHMLESKDKWNEITEFITNIMKTKEEDERKARLEG